MEEAPPSAPPVASWSDIPVELAGLVLGRLPPHVDRVRFAAVCPQWRAAAQQVKVPPPMPMLLVPDGTMYSLPGSKPFHFPDCAGYADACGTGNWLVFRDEGSCFLRDPFSNATVTLLALSCADCSINIQVHGGVEDYTWIAVCQPGATSWWSVRIDQWAPLFHGIVFHQGKLYALDCMDTLFAVDISMDHSTGDPCVSQIQEVISGLLACHSMLSPGFLSLMVRYLVESRGELLVVCRTIDLHLKPGQNRVFETKRNRFEVFEANFGQSSWTKVTTLGDDQVLFLRQRCCRSVSVSHKEVPRDCIFFLDNDVDDSYWHDLALSRSCSVYSMRGSKVSTALPTVSWKHATVFSTWLFPQG